MHKRKIQVINCSNSSKRLGQIISPQYRRVIANDPPFVAFIHDIGRGREVALAENQR